MGHRSTPNLALAALLAEARWSGATLARQVNLTAGEAGRTPALDRRAASFWLAGRWSRPPLPELIAETLSRALGRTVTVQDVGLNGSARPDPRTAPIADPVAALADLARFQELPPAFLGGVYSLSLLAVPSWEQAAARSRPAGERQAAPAVPNG